MVSCSGSADIKKSDIEDQGGEGFYGTGRAGAVAKIVWNDYLPPRSDRHFPQSCCPACDQFIKTESGRSPLLCLVEDLAVDKSAGIIYRHKTLWRRFRAIPFCQDSIHDSVEHDIDSGALRIFLKKLLIPELV